MALEALFSPMATPTLAEQVADKIVDGIASRRLAAGQRLIETEIAVGLEISRVPVREAMRILQSQGIIVATPRRGMRVARFDEAWAKQLHDVRVAMERLCARTTSGRLRDSPTLRARVEQRVAAVEAAVSTRDWLVINRVDLDFHAELFAIADSPLLSTLWTTIARHVLIMFSIETYRDKDYARVVEEHRAYQRVLLAGTRAEIDAEIHRHVAGLRIFGPNDLETPPTRRDRP